MNYRTYLLQYQRYPNDHYREMKILAPNSEDALQTLKDCEGERVIVLACQHQDKNQ